jgi:hypothetical protein
MKSLCLLVLLVVALPAFAAAAEAGGESSFHLLNFKCEPEANDEADSTPQSPPLEVDDPSTPGCNRWEINVVVSGDLNPEQKSWDLPLLDVNYGIGDNIQLKYEVPYLNNRSADVSTSAMGESKAGVKYMFYENDESKTEFAIYPQMSFVGSNSDAVSKGLVSPGKIVTLPLLVATKVGQTSRGDINLTANLGYNASTKSDVSNYLSAALGVGMPLIHRLSIMSEISTEQAFSKNADDMRDQNTKVDLGFMGLVNQRFMLFGSVGHSLKASDGFDHVYTVAGFRVLASGFGQ